MKILSLLFLLLSTHSMAGHDWQYSIKHPDGKIETKNVKDSDGFFLHVGETLCSVSENEDHQVDDDYYDIDCMKNGGGVAGSIIKPHRNEEFIRWSSVFTDKNNKVYSFEILIFNYSSKKNRKPFSDDVFSKDLSNS